MSGVYNNVLELIGDTPMVKLNRVTKDIQADVFAKLECFNPGHSSKDRIALHIIEQAEKKGLIKPGATIVETTSGNTGFSIATISIVKGYKCILAVSDKTKADKVAYLKAMGAEVHICPANVSADDCDSYYEVAKQIARDTPNSIYINQYFNELNADAHYCTTGPEIWRQTEGKITHLVACAGTGGTISGTAKFLKEQNPDIKVYAIDAKGSVLKTYHETGEYDKSQISAYKIEGLGKSMVPGALDCSVIDHFERVDDEQSAYSARELALKEGLLLGYTSGAALQGLRQMSDKFKKGDHVVVLFPDHGSRYMQKVYSDDWMHEYGYTDQKAMEDGLFGPEIQYVRKKVKQQS